MLFGFDSNTYLCRWKKRTNQMPPFTTSRNNRWEEAITVKLLTPYTPGALDGWTTLQCESVALGLRSGGSKAMTGVFCKRERRKTFKIRRLKAWEQMRDLFQQQKYTFLKSQTCICPGKMKIQQKKGICKGENII